MREDNLLKEAQIADRIVDGSTHELKFHGFNWGTRVLKSVFVCGNMRFRSSDWLH